MKHERWMYGGLAIAGMWLVAASQQVRPVWQSARVPAAAGQGGLLDTILGPIGGWVAEVMTAVMQWIYSGIITTMDALIHPILTQPLLTRTDPLATYANGGLDGLWSDVQTAAFSLLAVVVVWEGWMIMSQGGLPVFYRELREVGPRFLFGGVLIGSTRLLTQEIIDLNNALCTIPSSRLIQLTASVWHPTAPGLANAVFSLALGSILILLAIQEFIRLAFLDLLLVASPLAMLCWISPDTQVWTRWWMSSFIASTLVQFLQVLILAVGGVLLNASDQLTLFVGVGDVSQLILGCALFYLVFKAPGWLRALGDAQPGNLVGDITGFAARLVILSKLV